MGNEIEVREECGLVQTQLTIQQLLTRKKQIQEIQAKVMTEGIDYGIIPGCAKPTLLKPGAETLNVTFGLRPILNPETDIKEVELPNNHRQYQVTVHILSANGQEIATGVGSCSTMESKYRYRKSDQKCPKCGKKTIKKGSKKYGGGWYCSKKDGGCGEKFRDGDPLIENQEMERIEYDNPADYYNTCLKIAKKRALVDGTINATAVSHIFTQDIEDMAKEVIGDMEYIEVDIPEQPQGQERERDNQPQPVTKPVAEMPQERETRNNPLPPIEPAEKKTIPATPKDWDEIKHWKDGDAKRGTCAKCGKKRVFCYLEGGLCYDCKHN